MNLRSRLAGAVFVAAVLAAMLLGFATPLFPAVLACLAAVSLYELSAAGGVKNRAAAACLAALAAAIPLVCGFVPHGLIYAALLCGASAVLLRCAAVRRAAAITAAAFFVPLLYAVMFFYRALPFGVWQLALAVTAAWGADLCAYFVGSLCGKHKLCPLLSPKKTVEGAVGGVVGGVLLTLLVACGAVRFGGIQIAFWRLALSALAGTLCGMLGDLAASYCKRTAGVKDFGRVFLGHGGVLDRFDSVLLTAPVMLSAAFIFPVIGG